MRSINENCFFRGQMTEQEIIILKAFGFVEWTKIKAKNPIRYDYGLDNYGIRKWGKGENHDQDTHYEVETIDTQITIKSGNFIDCVTAIIESIYLFKLKIDYAYATHPANIVVKELKCNKDAKDIAIEKLSPIDYGTILVRSNNFVEPRIPDATPENMVVLQNKINELVDAVNKLTEEK